MSRFVLTSQAEFDLVAIWDFIARDSAAQANRVIAKIERALQTLASHPEMGHIREEWADRRHRFWPVYSYIVMYRPKTRPLQVLRIISGYRDLVELLSERP